MLDHRTAIRLHITRSGRVEHVAVRLSRAVDVIGRGDVELREDRGVHVPESADELTDEAVAQRLEELGVERAVGLEEVLAPISVTRASNSGSSPAA